MTNRRLVAGVDYSMTCPAACVFLETGPIFWYAHADKLPSLPHVTSEKITVTSIIPRAKLLAQSLVGWMLQFQVTDVCLEDYAFGATGRVFHIGENAGVFKYLCEEAGIAVTVVAPTVVKRLATGKGNATKEQVTEKFLAAYPTAQTWITNFFPRANTTTNVAKSPLADLADAYWIAKHGTLFQTLGFTSVP